MKKILLLVVLLSGCATLTNDPMTPIALSFSSGADGKCTLQNKRGIWQVNLPATVYVRRSDDALRYDCETETGQKVVGSIESEMEGGKMAASVFFWDFGITDAITDKHRKYTNSFVIPVSKQ